MCGLTVTFDAVHLSKGGNGIFNRHGDPRVCCCVEKDETGTDESAQVLT